MFLGVENLSPRFLPSKKFLPSGLAPYSSAALVWYHHTSRLASVFISLHYESQQEGVVAKLNHRPAYFVHGAMAYIAALRRIITSFCCMILRMYNMSMMLLTDVLSLFFGGYGIVCVSVSHFAIYPLCAKISCLR